MSKKPNAKNIFKVRRSINRKAFFITLILTLGIGITVLMAGFYLYLMSVTQEYFVSTWNLANAEAAVVEQEDYKNVSDRILKVYDSIPEKERGDGQSPEYRAKFEPLIDDEFRQLQQAMRDLQDRNGPMNAFVVAMDRNAGRMIYLVDADKEEATFCYPGSWESYDQKYLDALVDGRKLSKLHKKMGLTRPIQAVITNQPKFGIRCTAGSTLFETDKYTVMVCVDERMEPLMDISLGFLWNYLALLAFVTVIASFIGMLLIRKLLVKPINRLAAAARAYAEDTDKSDSSRHFEKLGINTGDEIENLATTLQSMEKEVAHYVDNLSKVTAERERAETELKLAARIQKSMLPDEFPPFPDRTEFDIYASMEPAREVGGDFYDFFLIDDDHLAIEIADVSDKGVPAAIFMTAAKILLIDAALEGGSSAQILNRVNNRICARNRGEMFVTVWLGILEISTGRITAANAGHEYPIIVHEDGRAEKIHDKHGFVIGGMEDIEYTDYEIQLEKGDRIFVYTDGVTEASTSSKAQFGMDRLIGALEICSDDADPQETIQSVRKTIEDFVQDAEQFDDLTMLCMEYRG